MKKVVLLILLIVTQSLYAQADYIDGSKYNYNNSGFNFSVVNNKGTSPGLTSIDFFIQVPYSTVQFVKQGFRFNAAYTLTLKVQEEFTDSTILHDIWTEKVTAREFEKTKSDKSFNLTRKNLELLPGNYKVQCILEDENSQVKSRTDITTTVRSINDTLDISDIVLISRVVRGRRGDQIVPNIENRVTSSTNNLPFYFELYSNKERDLEFEFVLTDNMRKKSYKYPASKKVGEGKNIIYHSIDGVNFTLGAYNIAVNLLNDSTSLPLGRGNTFTSSYRGIPSTVKDLNKAIDQMIYIASTGLVDSIKGIPDYNNRLEGYVGYWDQHDPTPDTEENEVMEEYYARVDYSNRHFNSYYEGWKSDMGWIFITLGPPDNVYRQPMAMEEKPFELWTYYDINRTFKFTDETGFGHYRLVNPEYGDWLRYRY